MFVAFDKDGNRTHINQAYVKYDYYCPVCGEKLIIKKGEIKSHHFAHQTTGQCHDHWHYDMSDWHINWQSKFPAESQEVVLTKGEEKHRADVLIKNTVIEFQHSSLSAEEFEERNMFYKSLGYKVVWLFDMTEKWGNGIDYLNDDTNEKYKWGRPIGTFKYLEEIENDVDIYFQIYKDAKDNEKLQQFIKLKSECGDCLSQESENYITYHEYDEVEILKVSWVSPNGFERFCGRKRFNEKEFLNIFIPKHEIDTDPNDYYIKYRTKDNEIHYYGCPMKDNNSSYFMTCDCCEHKIDYIHDHSLDYVICSKRAKDLGVSSQINIKKVYRNEEGRVIKVTIIDGDTRNRIEYPEIENIAKTLDELWNEYNCQVMRCVNIKTGDEVQAFNPGWQRYKNGFVKGKIKKPGGDYSKTEFTIYNDDKPIWVMSWFKKKQK